jgi:hypothetical protein
MSMKHSQPNSAQVQGRQPFIIIDLDRKERKHDGEERFEFTLSKVPVRMTSKPITSTKGGCMGAYRPSHMLEPPPHGME